MNFKNTWRLETRKVWLMIIREIVCYLAILSYKLILYFRCTMCPSIWVPCIRTYRWLWLHLLSGFQMKSVVFQSKDLQDNCYGGKYLQLENEWPLQKYCRHSENGTCRMDWGWPLLSTNEVFMVLQLYDIFSFSDYSLIIVYFILLCSYRSCYT